MDKGRFKKLLKAVAVAKGYKILGNMRRRKILDCNYIDDKGFRDTLLLIRFCGLKDEFISFINSEYENNTGFDDIMTVYTNKQ